MKKIKYLLRSYFGFSKKETNGFIILILIMSVLLAAPWITKVLYTPSETTLIADTKKMDSLVALLETKSTVNHSQPAGSRPPLAPFDPNKVTENELEEIFGKRIAKTIVRFRSKGGRFFVKTDLMKIYGMPAGVYEEIKNFVLLPDSILKEKAIHRFNHTATSELKIDLNLADSIALQSLRGIGKVLSVRIVKYRNRLGGFIKLDQLNEVYGLDSSLCEEMKKHLFITPSFVPQKINILNATASQLEGHPYIGKRYSRIIVNYRNQHSQSFSLEDLKNIPSIKASDLEKMIPYIE